MDNIFDTLMEAIEENASPYYSGNSEYRREQFSIEQHLQWLCDHLSDEARAHLEQLRKAEFRTGTLERDALVRAAISAGIQFALPR